MVTARIMRLYLCSTRLLVAKAKRQGRPLTDKEKSYVEFLALWDRMRSRPVPRRRRWRGRK